MSLMLVGYKKIICTILLCEIANREKFHFIFQNFAAEKCDPVTRFPLTSSSFPHSLPCLLFLFFIVTLNTTNIKFLSRIVSCVF